MSAVSIVIVGAGPAGCYAALALRKELATAEISILDRLPVPYGLLRYGVAADHQGTKAVQHQFERMFERSGVSFVGGLEYGRDVDLDQLTATFDIVVLATGVSQDRRLGIEGETLEGALGAGRLTRALNSHPEAFADLPVVSPRVAVVGSGNVAVDLLRLLSKGSEEWSGSDMDDAVLQRIIPAPVTEIHLISRSSAGQARWDAAMLRELVGLQRPSFRLLTGVVEEGQLPAVDALRGLLCAKSGPTNLAINLHMACVVEQIVGQKRVEGIRIRSQAGERKEIALDTVLTAIGFESRSFGEHPARVYTTGWLKTGAQGAIPLHKTLSKQLAAEIAKDLLSGAIAPGRQGRYALTSDRTNDFAGWRRIDAFERAHAPGQRVRQKIKDMKHMYEVAGKASEAKPLGKVGAT